MLLMNKKAKVLDKTNFLLNPFSMSIDVFIQLSDKGFLTAVNGVVGGGGGYGAKST